MSNQYHSEPLSTSLERFSISKPLELTPLQRKDLDLRSQMPDNETLLHPRSFVAWLLHPTASSTLEASVRTIRIPLLHTALESTTPAAQNSQLAPDQA